MSREVDLRTAVIQEALQETVSCLDCGGKNAVGDRRHSKGASCFTPRILLHHHLEDMD